MKKFLIVFSLIASGVSAQSVAPSYIFYNQQQSLVNPAAVGTERGHTISVNIRNQWRGMTEAPQTQTLLTTHCLSERVGLGFSIASNEVFIQKQRMIRLDFSYAIPISLTSRLVAGIKGGGDLFDIDANQAYYYNNQYNTFYNGYRLHPTEYLYNPYLENVSGRFQPNVGTGLYYEHPDFYIGFSVPNMLASDDVRMDGDKMTAVSAQMRFYTLAGMYLRPTSDFTVKPMVQARFAQGEKPNIDMTLAGNFLDRAELGLTFRTEKAFNAYVFFDIPRYYLRVGYGFETYFQTHLNLQSRSSHEFLVQFKWLSYSQQQRSTYYDD